MAVPLRRAAGAEETYALPRQSPGRRQPPDRYPAPASKRLVRRRIHSNAEIRRASAWVFIGMASILFLMSITSIFVKAGVSRLNYSINSLQSENEEILLHAAKLSGKNAELRSLERIEAIAVNELGMIKNESVDYMVLSTTIVAEGKIRADRTETMAADRAGTSRRDPFRIEFLEKAREYFYSLVHDIVQNLMEKH